MIYKGVVSGIGEKVYDELTGEVLKSESTNLIYPEFDATVNNFIVGRNGIIEGLKITDNILSAGTCIALGYVGQITENITLDNKEYVYGVFVINHDQTEVKLRTQGYYITENYTLSADGTEITPKDRPAATVPISDFFEHFVIKNITDSLYYIYDSEQQKALKINYQDLIEGKIDGYDFKITRIKSFLASGYHWINVDTGLGIKDTEFIEGEIYQKLSSSQTELTPFSTDNLFIYQDGELVETDMENLREQVTKFKDEFYIETSDKEITQQDDILHEAGKFYLDLKAISYKTYEGTMSLYNIPRISQNESTAEYFFVYDGLKNTDNVILSAYCTNYNISPFYSPVDVQINADNTFSISATLTLNGNTAPEYISTRLHFTYYPKDSIIYLNELEYPYRAEQADYASVVTVGGSLQAGVTCETAPLNDSSTLVANTEFVMNQIQHNIMPHPIDIYVDSPSYRICTITLTKRGETVIGTIDPSEAQRLNIPISKSAVFQEIPQGFRPKNNISFAFAYALNSGNVVTNFCSITSAGVISVYRAYQDGGTGYEEDELAKIRANDFTFGYEASI